MTQANDSITVTPGTGATVATHLANSKEHQVIMMADSRGNLEGTVSTYSLIIPPTQTSAVDKIHFDLWNGSGSNIIRIRGVWVIPNVNINSGASVGTWVDLYRTSSVGTGGTTATYGGIVSTAATINPKDTTNPALPAGISARLAPAGGAAQAQWLDFTMLAVDDGQLPAYMNGYSWSNLIKEPQRGEQSIVLNPSEGFSIITRTHANNPQFGFFVDFTVE